MNTGQYVYICLMLTLILTTNLMAIGLLSDIKKGIAKLSVAENKSLDN